MKFFIAISLLSVFVQNSVALKCWGCELTNSSEACEFSYKCPKGTEYCETLVSEVAGHYSLILSCATKEKCGSFDGVDNDSKLEKCDHTK